MDGLDALIKSFARLGDDTAAAGIFADEENATKASFAEFGTVTAPPRPFMSKATLAAEEAAARTVRDAVGENVDAAGKGTVVAKSPAKAAADLLAETMRRTIDDGVPPPLAEPTIAARRSRGNSDTTPLRDTGAMRAAIRSKVGPGEGS